MTNPELDEEQEAQSQDDDLNSHGPSDVAQTLAKLKEAGMKAAREREHLPQPLFWSLFHSQIAEVRRKKDMKRALDKLLGDSE